jgi:hypothetical protein
MCDDADADVDGLDDDDDVEPQAATPRVSRAVAVARRLIGCRCLIRYLLSVLGAYEPPASRACTSVRHRTLRYATSL